MENEFYASIKLVSGEELFSLVSIEDNTDNPLILCDKPVTMKMVNTPDGSIVKVRTWTVSYTHLTLPTILLV